MGVYHMFAKAIFPAPLCAVLVLVLTMAACGNGADSEGSTLCGGGWPDLDRAMEEAEAELDFDVLVPTYLPATTSSIPEPTIHPRDEISLIFPPCSDITSDILGPQVIIEETTVVGGLPEPGHSDPPTERVQIGGTSALMQQGESFDAVSIAISWHQAGLSLVTHFQWGSRDADPPEITEQMEMEAVRVAESIIQQGDVSQSGR